MRTRRVQPRKPLRLAGYDYARQGAYYVTIETHNRELLFEDNAARAAVEASWRWLAERYSYVSLDEFVVMPNHLHAILVLGAGATKTLSELIGAFKTVATQAVRRLRDAPGVPVWQRSFYEHVVRGESDLERIRSYIRENPARWNEDEENPAAALSTRMMRNEMAPRRGPHT